MKNFLNKEFRRFLTLFFYEIINPITAMRFGFLFISGSVLAEKISNWTGIELFSLYGFLNYDDALGFSSLFHGLLNEKNLIPILFGLGLVVLFIQRYRELKNSENQRKRLNKATSLAIFESLFLVIILFAGVVGNMHILFSSPISNIVFILGITIPSILFSRFRRELAENIEKFIDSHTIKK